MNPHDPRRPPGQPQYPPQAPSAGWGPQPGQGGPPQGAYPQGQPPGAYPAQGYGQSPQGQPAPAQGQYPQGQYPQGPQGQYPQGPQGQYPQGQPYPQPSQNAYPQGQHPQGQYGPGRGQPYGGPPGPAAAKSGGAGKIVAIVIAVLVVLGGGIAAVAIVADGSSVSDDVDQSAVLQQNVQALMTAVATGDSTKVEEPLLNLVILPASADAWLKDTFGPELGKRLSDQYLSDVFSEMPSMIGPFKDAKSEGRSVIRITRLMGPGKDSDKYELNVLKNRKKLRALYTVSFTRPGNTGYAPADMYYFAIVDGHFGYLGHMSEAW